MNTTQEVQTFEHYIFNLSHDQAALKNNVIVILSPCLQISIL